MANVLINEDTMTDIADAIRSKKGVSTTYKPADMPSAIESISGGGVTPTGTINITTNGTHDVTNYASANVAVPQGSTPTGTKQISITQNGTITEDVSAYANAEITVNIQGGGGGTSKAEGTATLSADAYFPTITHNLGTQKVAVIIYPIATVVAHGGYRNWIYEQINYPEIIGNQTFTLDFRDYNSTKFPDVVQVSSTESSYRIANANASPWTSQSQWYQGNAQATDKSQTTFTDNDITIRGGFFCSGTYKWIVYALD